MFGPKHLRVGERDSDAQTRVNYHTVTNNQLWTIKREASLIRCTPLSAKGWVRNGLSRETLRPRLPPITNIYFPFSFSNDRLPRRLQRSVLSNMRYQHYMSGDTEILSGTSFRHVKHIMLDFFPDIFLRERGASGEWWSLRFPARGNSTMVKSGHRIKKRIRNFLGSIWPRYGQSIRKTPSPNPRSDPVHHPSSLTKFRNRQGKEKLI